MPEQKTLKRASQDKRQGKSASTQAGEFIKEQIHHVREGKHGVRSSKQAIAIGLSEARRSGVKLAAPKTSKASAETREHARHDLSKGAKTKPAPKSATRSRATTTALKREGRAGASHRALAAHAKTTAKRRTAADRSAAARKARKPRGRLVGPKPPAKPPRPGPPIATPDGDGCPKTHGPLCRDMRFFQGAR